MGGSTIAPRAQPMGGSTIAPRAEPRGGCHDYTPSGTEGWLPRLHPERNRGLVTTNAPRAQPRGSSHDCIPSGAEGCDYYDVAAMRLA